MTRDELASDTGQTIGALNDKVREVLALGKPAEAAEYAGALQSAAAAFDYLDHEPDDE